METRGEHVLVDIKNLENQQILSNPNQLIVLLSDSAKIAGATVIKTEHHEFQIDEETCGLSVMIILSESHISAHTWPEHNYISLDMYTCGTCKPLLAVHYISKYLNGNVCYQQHIIRGVY